MPAKIDLTGQHFGELTVIEEGPHKYGRVAQKCKCSCGKKDLLYTSNDLREGKITSCGCKQHERCVLNGQKNKIDLTNQKINFLTVLKDSGKRQQKSIVQTCQCDCGNIVDVVSYALIKGTIKSCGCQKKKLCGQNKVKNLLGMKFGKLTPIKMFQDENAKRDHTFQECQCDCGNTKIVNSRNLLRGNTQSCGCLLSKGEAKLQNIFEENNIIFETQKTFDDCRFPESQFLARFDFYLPEYNLLIEYDGIQHFQSTSQNNYEQNIQRDKFKSNQCKENNIPLLRILYTAYNKLDINFLRSKINEVISSRSEY